MLKQLRLAKELELKCSKLESYQEKETSFKTRSEELERAINEAATEEDMKLVDEELNKLEQEKQELEEEKKPLEQAIQDLENELEDLKKQSEEVSKSEEDKQVEERGHASMDKYFELRSVKEFYENLRDLKTRGVTGSQLTVPQEVINRVMVKVNDYASLYPLVDKIKVKGTARVLIDTDETGATWMEMTSEFSKGDTGTITNIDFDGYKLGKLTTIDNSILQDSIINLDAYITQKIAKAIAKSIDSGILNGEGSSSKQPEGIITKLEGSNKVTVKDATSLAEIVAPIAKIDTGKDDVGEIVAVMNRTTYYNRILALNVGTNAQGQVVATLPNLASPTILGLKVIFSAHMTDDQVLFGDFTKYTLVEREDITIEKSEHAFFAQDQLAFLGKGRFDGKPTNKNAFALVTLEYTPVV